MNSSYLGKFSGCLKSGFNTQKLISSGGNADVDKRKIVKLTPCGIKGGPWYKKGVNDATW